MTDTSAEPGSKPEPAEGGRPDPGDAAGIPRGAPRLVLVLPRWFRFVPFFMSALLYLSAFFAVFSPLPLLVRGFRAGRRWTWLAAATNLAIVIGLSGPGSGAVYAALALAPALLIPELLRRRCAPEKTAAWSLAAMFAVGATALAAVALSHHVSPIQELRSEVTGTLDVVSQSLVQSQNEQPSHPAWMDPAEFEEWKGRIWTELPSSLAIFSLVIVWANLLILLRLNPGGVRTQLGLAPDFPFTWKAPDWLVWPTIACGIFVVFDVHPISVVAVNLFKFLMAVYVIQGLSVVGYFLNLWKIRGLFRTLAYAGLLLLLLPLLLGIGFFDLWFDFRAKFRQS